MRMRLRFKKPQNEQFIKKVKEFRAKKSALEHQQP
jgi:hypothetical protein